MDSRSASRSPSTSMSSGARPAAAAPAATGRSSRRGDDVGADGVLDRERQPGPDRLDDRRRAALLAGDRVVEIAVGGRVDERDRAAAGRRRAPGCGSARVAGPAPRASAGRRRTCAARGTPRPCGRRGRARTRPSGSARTGRGGVVPAGQRAVLVQQPGDRRVVGEDPGDVGGGREAADQQAAGPRTGSVARAGRPRSTWPCRSAPITTTSAIDSRHGSSLEWCSYGPTKTTGRSAAGMWVLRAYRSSRFSGSLSARMATSLLTAAGGARAAEQDHVAGPAADAAVDDRAGLLAQRPGLPARRRGLGVGVRVAGQHLLADEVLDENQRPAGGGVVGVRDPARPVRPPGTPRPRRSGRGGSGPAWVCPCPWILHLPRHRRGPRKPVKFGPGAVPVSALSTGTRG